MDLQKLIPLPFKTITTILNEAIVYDPKKFMCTNKIEQVLYKYYRNDYHPDQEYTYNPEHSFNISSTDGTEIEVTIKYNFLGIHE